LEQDRFCSGGSRDILDEGYGHNDSHIGRYSPNGQFVPYVMEPQPGLLSGPDSLQPVSGWWIYEVAETKEDGNSKGERLETYLERNEDLELG
jgi:hypothetical protein